MIEANNRLPQATTPAQAQTMSERSWCLREREQSKAAKRQFQAQGLKPQRMAWKEIAAAGDVYLANHRELIAEAKETVRYAEGMFGPRGGIRIRVRRDELNHLQNQRSNYRKDDHPITIDFGSHTQRSKPMTKRAALYVRISTDRQTVENQIAALSKVAAARGWQIVETFSDAGISGVKGRKDRAGLDEMLKQAQRGKFDVVMA